MANEKKAPKSQPSAEPKKMADGKNGESIQATSQGGAYQQQPKAASFLSLNQKIALVAAAAIIALVLAVPLFTSNPAPPVPSTPVTSQEFMGRLAYAPSVGIFMDARGVTDAAQRQKLFQCGADLASSLAGSPVLAEKERIVAACDDASCLLSNQSGNRTINATPSEILSTMNKIAYIHIKGGADSAPTFYANRMEFPISAAATGSCRIGATQEEENNSLIPSIPKQIPAVENTSETQTPPPMPALNGTPANNTPQTGGGPQQ